MNQSFPADLAREAHSLFRRGFNEEEVSLELRQKGAAENLLQDLINHVKQIRSGRRKKSGFLCCAVGIFLLVFGCMLTFFLYNNGGDIRFVMYGLTTIGVGFTIKGMIDLLGW